MRRIEISIAFLACLIILGPIEAADEAAIEALRPKILFNEDFENYAIGAERIDGKPSDPDLNTGQIDAPSVETQAGGNTLPSKQLVLSEGSFAWETDPITLNEPIVTTASVDLTAIAGPSGFAKNDRVRIYARLGIKQIAPDPLLDVALADRVPANSTVALSGYLPMGSLAEARWDNDLEVGGARGGLAGVLTRPRTLRLVMVLESKNPDNFLAIDNLVVYEESATVNDPARWERETRQLVAFNVSPDAVLEPNTPSLEFGANYVQRELTIELDSLSDGDICLGSRNPLEDQRFHPVRNVRVGVGQFNRETLFFTMDRPSEGWRSVSYWPGLFVCQEGKTPVPIDKFAKVGGWANPPWSSNAGESSIGLEPLSVEPIEGSEPYVDFTVRIDSPRPYPQDNLGEIEVYASIGWVGGERVRAQYLGITETLENGGTLRLRYRLNRPSYGWPTQKIQIDIVGELSKIGGNGFSNFLRVAPGRSPVEVMLPPAEFAPPGESGPASSYAQFVLATEEAFAIKVDYVSNVAIDLDSIGDGDLIFQGQPNQLGKLVSIEPSNGNRKVQATFEFQRDPLGYRNGRYISLKYPSGAVSNIDGETTIGLSLKNPRFINIPLWKDPEEAEILSGFVPLGTIDPALESYRFRILYQSTESPINQTDFDNNHLLVSPESLTVPSILDPSSYQISYAPSGADIIPTVTTKEVMNEGRRLLVDYRVDKPAAGWPQILRIQLLNGGLRDDRGRTIFNREVAVIGRNDLKAVNAELVGGQLIEGDPDTHHLSFLVQMRPEWYALWPSHPLFGPDLGTFEGAYPMLGWDREILPALEEGETSPPTLGRFASLRTTGYRTPSPSFSFTDNKVVMNLEIDRPDDGWDTWDLGRVPYVVQAPGLKKVPSSVIASGFITLANPKISAPLLFSFEDWIKRLEEQAELPEGSLKEDADGDRQDGLTEFILGSDLQDKQDTAIIEPDIVMKNGMRYAKLKFNIRINSLGLTAELQHSANGKEWRSADDEFGVIERTRARDGIDAIQLLAKEPLANKAPLGLFRIAIAR